MNSTVSVLRQKQIGPFGLVEKSYAAGATLPRHEHAHEFVSFLLAGEYDELSLSETRTCLAGTVIWHPRTESHADQFHSTGGLVLDLEIDSAWLDDTAQALDVTPRARLYRGGLAYSLGLKMYCGLADAVPGIQDLATDLLSFFFSGILDRHPPGWLRRAIEMAGAIDEERLTLTRLACEVGVHPVHVARCFRRFLGCTFGDYVAKARVCRALELLRSSDHTVADVAYACGFADHAHLSRTFKKVTGLTPLSYRRTACPAAARENEERG